MQLKTARKFAITTALICTLGSVSASAYADTPGVQDPGASPEQLIADVTGSSAETVSHATSVSGNIDVEQAQTPSGKPLETYVQDRGVNDYSLIAVLDSGSPAQFNLDLPNGAHLIQGPDGSVVAVTDAASSPNAGVTTQEVAAVLEEPWAVDATGRDLPTHYKVIDSTTVEQIVDTSTATFPVVADPSIKPGFHLGPVMYLHFNRQETINARNGGYKGAWITAACALMPNKAAALLCGGVIGTDVAKFQRVSQEAVAQNRCFAMRVPLTGNPIAGDVWHTKC